MRFYLDQMLALSVAELLMNEGHDVLRASDVGQSRADDAEILQEAISQDRVLITLDEHFGDWVILPLKRHPGVIRVKVNPATSPNVVKLLIPFLRSAEQNEFRNHLVILSPKRSKWIRTADD